MREHDDGGEQSRQGAEPYPLSLSSTMLTTCGRLDVVVSISTSMIFEYELLRVCVHAPWWPRMRLGIQWGEQGWPILLN